MLRGAFFPRRSGWDPKRLPTVVALPSTSDESADGLATAFESYLRCTCGVASTTWKEYGRVARAFLQSKYGDGPVDLSTLSSNDLAAYVSDYATRVRPGTVKALATALRSFLRWLQFRGVCDARLVAAVPTVAYPRQLSHIPKLLTDDQIRLLLKAFDRTTAQGRRDYAMTLCLVRLALRSCEVARLTLDDLDWRDATVRISTGKGQRSHRLPLPKDIGQAIVVYLRQGRPSSQHRQVFLRHKRPVGTPISSDAVQSVIKRAHRRGEVGARGTHVLRHTAASRLLRAGATLKEIADILGHRSLDTTAIYAKVDMERLAAVALPWPEVFHD